VCLTSRVKGEEASDLDDPNSKDKPKEVVSKPHSSYQHGRSLDHEGSVHGM